ncbi:unnamed protein product [Pleuronectes platessa]|uniref:Uncharacterized protein n=1 Tax=Pleuronectes platessa TaxID=8262 RepID=A0A9N7UAZ8_PLEPL|nr:unnamed protein product [Pleuronectes platessa]
MSKALRDKWREDDREGGGGRGGGGGGGGGGKSTSAAQQQLHQQIHHNQSDGLSLNCGVPGIYPEETHPHCCSSASRGLGSLSVFNVQDVVCLMEVEGGGVLLADRDRRDSEVVLLPSSLRASFPLARIPSDSESACSASRSPLNALPISSPVYLPTFSS